MRFFDASDYPFVVATPPAGENADRDIPEFYREWDGILARGPHVVLIDLSVVNPLFIKASHRRRIAEEIEARRAVLDRTLRAEARLCSNAVVRGFFTALDWFVGDTFSFPVAYFDDRAEAEQWLRAQWRAWHDGPRRHP